MAWAGLSDNSLLFAIYPNPSSDDGKGKLPKEVVIYAAEDTKSCACDPAEIASLPVSIDAKGKIDILAGQIPDHSQELPYLMVRFLYEDQASLSYFLAQWEQKDGYAGFTFISAIGAAYVLIPYSVAVTGRLAILPLLVNLAPISLDYQAQQTAFSERINNASDGEKEIIWQWILGDIGGEAASPLSEKKDRKKYVSDAAEYKIVCEAIDEARTQYNNMMKELKKCTLCKPESWIRNSRWQEEAFIMKVKEYPGWKKKLDKAQEETLKYKSAPGTSRHHWGTDFDIFSTEPDDFKDKGELNTGRDGLYFAEYQWLKLFASYFGFIQAYTGGTNGGLCYEEERWHWSYWPVAQALLDFIKDNLDTMGDKLEERWNEYNVELNSEKDGKEDYFSYCRQYWRDYVTCAVQEIEFKN